MNAGFEDYCHIPFLLLSLNYQRRLPCRWDVTKHLYYSVYDELCAFGDLQVGSPMWWALRWERCWRMRRGRRPSTASPRTVELPRPPVSIMMTASSPGVPCEDLSSTRVGSLWSVEMLCICATAAWLCFAMLFAWTWNPGSGCAM